MDEIEKLRRGFNAGYSMEKLNPELARKLRSGMVDKNEPFVLGFFKGGELHCYTWPHSGGLELAKIAAR